MNLEKFLNENLFKKEIILKWTALREENVSFAAKLSYFFKNAILVQ